MAEIRLNSVPKGYCRLVCLDSRQEGQLRVETQAFPGSFSLLQICQQVPALETTRCSLVTGLHHIHVMR